MPIISGEGDIRSRSRSFKRIVYLEQKAKRSAWGPRRRTCREAEVEAANNGEKDPSVVGATTDATGDDVVAKAKAMIALVSEKA